MASLLASSANGVLMSIDFFLEVSGRTSAVLININEITVIFIVILVIAIQNSDTMILSICRVIQVDIYIIR